MKTSRLILRMMMPTPTYEGEGGGGGGGADAGRAAAAAAAAAADEAAKAGGDKGGAWAPPQGMVVPPDFLGTSAEDTLAKTLKGYGELNTRAEGLRTTLAGKPSAPEKPEAYTFKPTDDIAKFFGEVDKHPAMTVARTAAHKHGLSQAQFEGFVNDVYGELGKAGSLAEPYNAASEVRAYAEAGGLDANMVAQHFTENETFAKGIVAQLQLPPKLAAQAQAELTALTDTAGGNALLAALRGRLGENGIRVAGDPINANAPISDAEFATLRADPRIDPKNENHPDAAKRYDPALRQKYSDAIVSRSQKKPS